MTGRNHISKSRQRKNTKVEKKTAQWAKAQQLREFAVNIVFFSLPADGQLVNIRPRCQH
ncbi:MULTISPECIES: hypothetical protein [Yersinia]|uniref:Uncharacterized protein n=1 Tax=Yersinia intermedia TaxID=631 RepID=A0ABX6F914_YERIN|nr:MULTISPECIES: hypothetical protein [Yersinia]EEQ20058.1 hypothetical protein yinte0001_18020 [Yersinia intermedia ATCC 29909]MDA5493687.1 hypothetical protein [Yersinia intermedia]QGR66486.1 hypothetical protein FOC38_11445 [Yersinia intermedia]QGR71502.1 hypothetical protein FOC37_14745 [Yersinia intermedia]